MWFRAFVQGPGREAESGKKIWQSANGFAMPVGSSKAMMSNQKSSQDSRQEGLEKNYDERVLYRDATAIVYQTRASSLATPQKNAHSQQWRSQMLSSTTKWQSGNVIQFPNAKNFFSRRQKQTTTMPWDTGKNNARTHTTQRRQQRKIRLQKQEMNSFQKPPESNWSREANTTLLWK